MSIPTKVTKSAFLSDSRVYSLENGLPKDRFIVTANHQQEDWNFLVRGKYYGKIGVANDIEMNYTLSENLLVIFGVENLYDTTPDKVPLPELSNGHVYPEESPFGYRGGFYYLQLNYIIN